MPLMVAVVVPEEVIDFKRWIDGQEWSYEKEIPYKNTGDQGRVQFNITTMLSL